VTQPSSPSSSDTTRAGLLYGLAAYLWWGFVPLYFKLLTAVPVFEVLSHRIFWSLLFLTLLIGVQRRWREVAGAIRSQRLVLILMVTTLLLATNWGVFIWAVDQQLVLQASLGYFINPLVTVMLGVIFLHERLRPWQTAAVALATIGVLNLAITRGEVPWVSLALAFSFGGYGLLRKIVSVGTLVGLLVEITLIAPVGLFFVTRGVQRDQPWASSQQAWLYLMLIGSGIVTTLPLIWFNRAARRLRLSTLGFLQYVGPTCQFFVAVIIFREQFTLAHGITFGLIWLAVAVYSLDSVRAYRERKQESVQEPVQFMQD
jgi:chloramphenicol-sensitive protein RarD